MEDFKHFKSILIAILIGIWFLVFQNAGIIPQVLPTKITSDTAILVRGSVDIESIVYVKGRVDANIESINGYAKFYKDPRTGQYYVLPVTDPYE